jgi:Ring finger domain
MHTSTTKTNCSELYVTGSALAMASHHTQTTPKQRPRSASIAAIKGAGAFAEAGSSVAGGDNNNLGDTCVICMEKLQEGSGGVLTTVCNHTFHVDCLVKWEDSPCPVCRFHHNGAGQQSTCQVKLKKFRVHIYIYIYMCVCVLKYFIICVCMRTLHAGVSAGCL